MNFKEFVSSKNEIKIGFLGGSITYGSGSSNLQNCFRERVVRELSEMFPNTEFSGINAAIGGTTSSLGVFRADFDMMRFNPDMVFIEFAVNDWDMENTDVYMEGIVRQILKAHPKMPIVFIYTATKRTMVSYDEGKLPAAVEKHEKLAKKYGIPSINVGLYFYNKIKEKNAKIEDFTTDTVHPNDIGYGFLTDCIMQELPMLDFNIVMPEKPVTGKDYSNAKMVLTEGFANDDWKLSKCKMYQTLPNYIYSNVPGTSLKFDFEGSVIGLYFTMEKDSGDILCSIDGSEFKKISTWDIYCNRFNRDNSRIVDDTLEYGKHTLEIKISDQKAEESEGTYIRIGAFLVC